MSTVTVTQGNIALLRVDCVVNAANRRLQAGSGVCGAIFSAAGEAKLQAACDRIGGCREGGAVITPGFDLPARYIIHAVGPVWDGGTNGEEELLAGCYRASLELARENGIRTIAFPVISSGVFGYPKEDAWRVAVGTVRAYQAQHPDYDLDVTFAVQGGKSFALGQKILAVSP